MQNQRLPKVSMTKSGHPSSFFNFSHDVNTTADFGVCQPLMCKQLIPGSKTTLSTESLTRLAPMVAPTFGRIKYKIWHQFVEIRDICEQFDAMMAQQPIYSTFRKQTYVPYQVPFISLKSLSSLCFIGAHATLYLKSTGSAGAGQTSYSYDGFKSNVAIDMASLVDIIQNLVNTNGKNVCPILPLGADSFVNTGSTPHLSLLLAPISSRESICNSWAEGSNATLCAPLGNTYDPNAQGGLKYRWLGYVYDSNGKLINNPVSPDNADFLFDFTGTSSGVSKTVTIAFRFSDFGKRLRKILIGLGYQLDLTSPEYVSFLPYLVVYKAYWNIFGLTQWQDWQQTSCAKLIKLLNVPVPYLDNLSTDDTSRNEFGMEGYDLFVQFVKDLGDFFITDSTDFVSAHLPSTAVSPSAPVYMQFVDVPGATINNVSSQGTVDGSPSVSDNSISGHSYMTSTVHGHLDEEYLKRLYRWTNRNTVIGRRIAELLRAQGLGNFVDECESDFIGYTEDVIPISDVVSSADTSFAGSQGAQLGQFGGKGVGYTKGKSFTFENKNFGYWISLAAIVPESGYSQQVDGLNFAINKSSFYNPEFDSLGFSPSTKALVQGAKDTNDNSYGELRSTFGFKPRYFEYKFAQNVTNGDMSLRSTRDNYLPYFLDRFIVLNDKLFESVAGDESKFKSIELFDSYHFPIAGNLWRYPTKFKWLGNLDRMFTSYGKKDDLGIIVGSSSMQSLEDWAYYCTHSNDNFLIHNIFDMQVRAPMLAVEDSFETKDEDEKANMKVGKA